TLEIALALLALHRRLGVAVDQPPLPLRAARLAQLGDNIADCRRIRLDCPAQRVAPARPEPHWQCNGTGVRLAARQGRLPAWISSPTGGTASRRRSFSTRSGFICGSH